VALGDVVTSERPIEFGPTRRGALVGKFTDRYGAHCSLQESSYPEEECLWLGVEVDSMGEDLPSARMHLTRELARELAEVLLHFAAEGSLGLYDATDYQVGQWVVGVGKENHGVLGRVVEAHAGSLIRVQNARSGSEVWECSWSLVPSTWVPTEGPPRGVSLFERLEASP
jgi:hypothetical protein